MSRLGYALLQSTDELIEAVTARAHRKRELAREPALDGAVEESFERLGGLATIAVARWIAGEPVDAAFAVGEDFSRVFAQMVASSDVPLGEVVRRCQYWRDACAQQLCDAVSLGLASEGACKLAQQSVDLASDHALASMSAIFDAERQQMQQELTRRQEELAFLATHDALTKLANRSLVVERLEQMLAHRWDDGVAVLFIDLDGFKEINDTLGHSAGDRLLAATAARLRSAVREVDTLGRLGGDEFVVIASSISPDGALQDLAARLREAFSEPFSISLEVGPLRITASIGVAVATGDCSAAQLLHDADIAMYSAKSRRVRS
jgi:diguanylate cyclase (GGDEF)-like protein